MPNREWIENGEIRWRARETGRRWRLQSIDAEFIVKGNRWRRYADLCRHHVAITGIKLVAQVSLLTTFQQSDGELLSLVFLSRRDSHPPDAPRIIFVVCCSVMPQCRNLSSIVLKPRPWREYWSPSIGRWSRAGGPCGFCVCVKNKIKIRINSLLTWQWSESLVWQSGMRSRPVSPLPWGTLLFKNTLYKIKHEYKSKSGAYQAHYARPLTFDCHRQPRAWFSARGWNFKFNCNIYCAWISPPYKYMWGMISQVIPPQKETSFSYTFSN